MLLADEPPRGLMKKILRMIYGCMCEEGTGALIMFYFLER